jgi:heme/copper-type cytochrome/quinol oxidase subunit 2
MVWQIIAAVVFVLLVALVLTVSVLCLFGLRERAHDVAQEQWEHYLEDFESSGLAFSYYVSLSYRLHRLRRA